jgi:branched-chain amino acid transport system substrate-binding protein
MDERQISKMFHETLEKEPPRGAFDRLQAALARATIVPARRPWITLRLPRTSQRFAAALLVAVLAMAAVGVFLVAHRAWSQIVPAGSRGTIEIGSDMNVSGAETQYNLPVQYGAAFAISRAGSVRGFALKLVPYDDAVQGVYNADRGVENVQRMILDPRLLGMVGPLRSPVSRAVLPIANRASLAMISPSNTDPCLTVMVTGFCTGLLVSPNDLRPTGTNNYFRLAAADSFQGPAMADFAYDALGLRRIAVWDDQYPGGVASADGFAAEFSHRGATVVSRVGFKTNTSTPPDFRQWLRSARAAGAQGIYAGASNYVCVARQQSQGIFDTASYYLGPSGLFDHTPSIQGINSQECIRDAGAMANDHMYATLGLGDANLNPSAAATIAAYERAHPDPADANAFTFAGYDCATILIEAIGRAIDANGGNRPSRRQVIDQLARTAKYVGLTGTYTFDSNGDPTTPTLQIVEYKNGASIPIQNITVAVS